jgi:hypothetical protein
METIFKDILRMKSCKELLNNLSNTSVNFKAFSVNKANENDLFKNVYLDAEQFL